MAIFQRFTEPGRGAVVLAQDESRYLGHDYIGTEHLLLGLLREERGLAARVLQTLGVVTDGVRERVIASVGRGEQAATGQIPFTPFAKQTLDSALRESLALGHTYVGTEHLLLGLVDMSESVAARILLELGLDTERVRTATLDALSDPPS